jgi:hypothetical protein
MEFSRQYVKDNNGRLLASTKFLKNRGWNSADVIHRAKLELIEAELIYETVKGHRPNKASWYAVTWYPLDKLNGYDVGAEKTFVRSAYRKNDGIKITPFIPSKGVESKTIEPSNGIDKLPSTPHSGAIRGVSGTFSIPSNGNHLDNHLN